MRKAKPVLVIAPPIAGNVELTFGQWLISQAKKVKTFFGVAMFFALANLLHLAISKYIALPENQVLLVTCSIQFVIVFAMIVAWTFVRRKHFDKTSDTFIEETVKEECGYKNEDVAIWDLAKKDAEKALRHYEHYWMALLISWLILYALLNCLYMLGKPSQEFVSYGLSTFVHFANNCATLAVLFCYFTLNQPETISSQERENHNERRWWLWAAILIVVTFVESACMALAMKSPFSQFLPENVSKVFGYISGIGASAVMALYINRLASRFLACPTWMIILLYIYMAIQPLIALFGAKTSPWAIVIIINCALLLKGLLYLFTIWLFEQNRLLFYFVRVRRLGDQVDTQMKNFSQLLKR